MALTNYGELKAVIAERLADDNLTSQIVDFVTLGEAQIFGDVRTRTRLLEATTDITVNAQTVSLPSRFVGVRRFYLNSTPVRNLKFLAPDQFWNRFISTTTDTPDFYTIEGENFVFAPSPDGTIRASFSFGRSPRPFLLIRTQTRFSRPIPTSTCMRHFWPLPHISVMIQGLRFGGRYMTTRRTGSRRLTDLIAFQGATHLCVATIRSRRSDHVRQFHLSDDAFSAAVAASSRPPAVVAGSQSAATGYAGHQSGLWGARTAWTISGAATVTV